MVYDYKKGLRKLAVNVGVVLISGLLVVWQDDPKYVGIIPVAKWILNLLKQSIQII